MNTAFLESVGFTKLAPQGAGDKRDEEWGFEGEGVALTHYPNEPSGESWHVRPRLNGGGVAIPSPPNEVALLMLMFGLGLLTADDVWREYLKSPKTTPECVLV